MSTRKLSAPERRELLALIGRMREARKIKDVSQKELGRQIGLSQSRMNEIERCLDAPSRPIRVPGVLTMSRVPAALGISGHWLMTGEGRMEDYHDDDPPLAAHIRGGMAVLAKLEQTMTGIRKDLLEQDEALATARAEGQAERAAGFVRAVDRERQRPTPAASRPRSPRR